ncbi:hypothetical protein M5689_014370 [Euphorbia peplus]|nr:hypothetical protein M5689_014370 [Euphorbia peplus]
MELSRNSWSSLPDELLREIFIQLNTRALDLLRCQRVCLSWQSAASSVFSDHTQTPLLLVLDQQDKKCSLFDILQQNNNHPEEEIDLSIHDRWICNSMSNGWILAADLSPPYGVYLSNPISRTEIFLPPATTLSRLGSLGFIKKGITSKHDPLEKDCVVLVIYGSGYSARKLAFCRPGDEEWRDCELGEEGEVSFLDIMLHKGKFYAADIRGKIYGCDLGSDNPKIMFIMDPPVCFQRGHKFLAESKFGDFLMICRNWKWVIDELDEDDEGVSTFFDVYKVDLSVKEWEKIEKLGDEALFVGCNSSGISYSDLKNSSSPRRRRLNCIYYIHDSIGGGDDEGYGGIKCVSIYDMESRKSKRLRTSGSWGSQQFRWFNI